MYANDTFFTLTYAGQIGLALLSATLAALTIWLSYLVARSFRLPLRLVIAVAALWAFTWLSPQIYYHYYQTQFEGLPWQIVVHPPPSAVKMFQLLAFQADNNLSDHSKGLLGWGLLVACVFLPRRRAV